MKALVINVPGNRVGEPTFISIDQIAATGVAKGFIISSSEEQQLTPGCMVVLVDNYYRKKRYEGRLVSLIATGTANNGQQRYDVQLKEASSKSYQYEGVNRWGTSVIDYP